jgi:hypothetical protein
MVIFTNKEIIFMKSLGLDFNFNDLSDDDWAWAEIEEKVGDRYTYDGFDDDYAKKNSIGVICEDILAKIPK